MEHTDIIVKIIEAEKAAREKVDEALQKKETLAQELSAQKDDMRERFMQRAKRRVDIIRQQEYDDAAASLKRLDEELALQRHQMEQRYADHRNEWADALFHFLIKSC